MDLTFLAQADSVTLKLELAKLAVETAKAELESAKEAHDELFAQAESHGIPRAKLKKITEDRVQALLESGMITPNPSGTTEAKRDRPLKKSKSLRSKPAGDNSAQVGDDTFDAPEVENADNERPVVNS